MRNRKFDDDDFVSRISTRRAARTKDGKAQYAYAERPRQVDRRSRSHSRSKSARRRELERLERMGAVPIEIIMTRPAPVLRSSTSLR
jgi:hypothetical protein